MCIQSIYAEQTREIQHQSMGSFFMQNSYCCNFQVYLGSTGNVPERNQGARVVKDLVSLRKNSGRNVTTDNFFTDISLAEDLLKININLLGTMRKTREDGISNYVFIKR